MERKTPLCRLQIEFWPGMKSGIPLYRDVVRILMSIVSPAVCTQPAGLGRRLAAKIAQTLADDHLFCSAANHDG